MERGNTKGQAKRKGTDPHKRERQLSVFSTGFGPPKWGETPEKGNQKKEQVSETRKEREIERPKHPFRGRRSSGSMSEDEDGGTSANVPLMNHRGYLALVSSQVHFQALLFLRRSLDALSL